MNEATLQGSRMHIARPLPPAPYCAVWARNRTQLGRSAERPVVRLSVLPPDSGQR